jgi:thymidylate kinase
VWFDFVLGWGPRIAYPKVRSSLVILERGWLDLAVDPRRYRVSLSKRWIELLGRALPQPNLTLVLDAPDEVVHARKPELEPSEINRQRNAWRAAAVSSPRFFVLDASASRSDVLDQALARIEDVLAARHA